MPADVQHPRPDQAEAHRLKLRPFIGSGQHILVIAQPKSGSTALCNILSEVTGWPVDSYADRSVSDIAFSTLQATKLANLDRVIHLHSLPTPLLRAWLIERKMVPVVLHRDVAAGILSMYRHQCRGDASLSEHIRSLPFEHGIEETAWMWAHWFVRFQREWRGNLCREPGLWINYRELFADPVRVARMALGANRIEVDPDTVEAAVRIVLSDAERSNNHETTGAVPAGVLKAIRHIEEIGKN